MKYKSHPLTSFNKSIDQNLIRSIKLLLLVVIVIPFYSYSQKECDCDKYRTGKFELINGDGSHSIFVRDKRFQSEVSGGIELKDRIEWLDECTFKLYPIKIKDDTDLIGNDVLIFKIIETFEHAYVTTVKTESEEDFNLEFKVYEYGYLDYDK